MLSACEKLEHDYDIMFRQVIVTILEHNNYNILACALVLLSVPKRMDCMTDGYMDEWKDAWIHECKDARMNGSMYEWMDKGMDGRTGGWTDG